MDPDKLITEALAENTFPGIAVQVEKKGKIIFQSVRGKASLLNGGEELKRDSLFGLASLTKPLATSLVLLHLLEQEGLSTEKTLGVFLPARSKDTSELKLHDILLHISGLPALPEMFKLFPDGNSCSREQAVEHLLGIKPHQPPRHSVVYSCTGFILLGLVAEKIGGAPLDKLFHQIVCEKAGLKDLMFNPVGKQRSRAVCEEFDPWRGRWIRGEVHDENAWTMGGVSGNAGLFGTLESVSALCEVFLNRGTLNGKRILPEEIMEKMTQNLTTGIEGDPRAYGTACNGPEIFAGQGFSGNSYGHTGFTGTSIWIDPERELKIVTLTNRVHFGREETAEKIKAFRRAFHPLFL